MVEVDELQGKVKVLKTKVNEEKDQKKLRALRKSLKRAQRKIRFLTGKKLAVLTGATQEEKTPPKADQPQAEAKAEKPVEAAKAPPKAEQPKAETKPEKPAEVKKPPVEAPKPASSAGGPEEKKAEKPAPKPEAPKPASSEGRTEEKKDEKPAPKPASPAVSADRQAGKPEEKKEKSG